MNSEEKKEQKKSGVVVLMGRSNVGKSTLLNALIGFKVSITSPLPQTTRHPIQGILNAPEGQVVFVDTPGFFAQVPDIVTQKINKEVQESLTGVDLVLYVVDPHREIGPEERKLLSMIEFVPQKKMLVINKIDLVDLPFLEQYRDLMPEYAFSEIIEISAKTRTHLEKLKQHIFESLSWGEFLYPESEYAPADRRLWLSEMIREKVYYHLHKEVPYTITCELSEVQERSDGILEIHANLITTEKKYRGMIVGNGGKKIKAIGTAARKELELLLQRRIFLKLEVLVDPHWQERF